MRTSCKVTGSCKRVAAWAHTPCDSDYAIIMCRKHAETMQANRLDDLHKRGVDPISYRRATASELKLWAVMPAGHFLTSDSALAIAGR